MANENALNRATDEGTVVEPELSQPISKSAKKHVNMYKNLRISNIFCTFAAAKVKLIYNMLFESQIHDLKMWLPWCRIRRDQAALRAIVEQQRRMMKPDDVASQSAQVVSQIEQMTAFREAKTVMLYYPVHNEVDLRPLLDKYAGEKTFLLPVTHRHSMEVRPYDGEDMMRRGRMGVPEPQTPTYHGHIDLIIVPGVVFDQHRHRIGRGGGYYDKFLRKQLSAKKIGVCYAFQLKKHDIPHLIREPKMDRVITPQQTIG